MSAEKCLICGVSGTSTYKCCGGDNFKDKSGKMIQCEVCNKEFYCTPSRIIKNKHHTCSVECSSKLASILHSKKIKTNCTNCGKELFYKKSHFKQISNPTCSRSCMAKIKSKINLKDKNPKALKLTETERFFHDKAQDCKRRANSANLPFDLDYKYLLDLYNKQNGKCYYTDIQMKFNSDPNRKNNAADWNVVSIDKIIPENGYIKDNVVFTLNCINMLKAHHSIDILQIVFESIYKKQQKILTKVKKLYSDSILPKQSDISAAGTDLYVHRIEDFENYVKVYTGIAIQPPEGMFFNLVPRSSIYKKGLTLYNNIGIIDPSYTGEIIGIFLKTKDYKGDIKIGERLCQLVPQKFYKVSFEEVESLSDTERGNGGFGSTGK